VYALRIQTVGLTLDELDNSRTVGQGYRPVLFWYRNNSRRQGPGDGSKDPGCADTHEHGVIGAVYRRCDPGGGRFQLRQPPSPNHFLRNHDVVPVCYAVKEPFLGQPS
jgi:hypothetical protein